MTPSRTSFRKKPAFLLLIVITGWTLLSSCSAYSRSSVPSEQSHVVNDFVEYWAAARLVLSGENPYSPTELFHLQRSVGWKRELPLLMWNPPLTLAFLLPFGLLDFSAALYLWLMTHTAILLFCVQQLWRLYGGPPDRYRLAWVLSLIFTPTLFVLALGQIAPLVLLGLLGFLQFQEKQQWLGAAAAILLIAIKPHIVYLFWPALILWIWRQRHWRLLWWGLIWLFIASSIPLIFNLSVFEQYMQLYQAPNVPRPFDWETPTLGRVLRSFLDEGALQYLPTILGLFWFLFHWRRHRYAWRWTEQMPLLLLVSSSTTFFAWTFDHVMLLPAVLQAAIWILYNGRRETRRLAFLSYVAMNLVVVAMKQYTITWNDFWCFWIAPALLITYLLLRSGLNSATPHSQETRIRDRDDFSRYPC